MESPFNPLNLATRDLLAWTVRTLREHGVKPRKKLSQNFAVDPSLIREITSHVGRQECVVEIGCGIGTLSMAILTKVKRLLCVEIDPVLCKVASEVVNSPRFIVVNGDARELPYTCEVVVSNIPYHITSDILVKISRENSVMKAVLTVQREVAERLTATPGSRNYGKITVLVNTLFTVQTGGTYSPRSFYPRPEVHHKVLVLTRKSAYTEEVRALEKVTKVFFSQRRRLVEKVLEEFFSTKIEKLGGIKDKVVGKRVFMIPPDLWLEISRALLERGLL